MRLNACVEVRAASQNVLALASGDSAGVVVVVEDTAGTDVVVGTTFVVEIGVVVDVTVVIDVAVVVDVAAGAVARTTDCSGLPASAAPATTKLARPRSTVAGARKATDVRRLVLTLVLSAGTP